MKSEKKISSENCGVKVIMSTKNEGGERCMSRFPRVEVFGIISVKALQILVFSDVEKPVDNVNNSL